MTYFFSKVEMKRDIQTIKRIHNSQMKDSYYFHQLLWKLFSDGNKKERDFIYRSQFEKQWPIFFIVSKARPVDREDMWEIQTKPYYPKLFEDQTMHFMLRVNPQVTRKRENDGKKVRYDVIQNAVHQRGGHEEKITADLIQRYGKKWLSDRAEKHGFEIITVVADCFTKERCYKQKEKQIIHFSTIDYQGILRVANPELMLNLLFHGIGPAKSFGCGLMMVKP